MDNKKFPFDDIENTDPLHEFLNKEKGKIMATAVDRIFNTLRTKTEKAKSACEKNRTEKNSKKFLDAAQDFYYFTKLLDIVESLTGELLLLQGLVGELTTRLEQDLGFNSVPTSNDDDEGGKPN